MFGLARRIAFLILGFTGALLHAQGGPPFIADDPGTPGNHNWEINLGWTGDHNPAHAGYQLPNIDINYGWGDRIQLKYELPIAAATDENNLTRVGLGESLIGVKWRFYEHHAVGEPRSEKNMDYSLGAYPQVSLNNPTDSVRRSIVESGPQYYLPIEATANFGAIKLNGEIGRWIGNRHTPSRWGRGLIVGREFNDRFELYGEVYDLQDANRVDGEPKLRELTADIGGRRSLDRSGHVRLLFMGGRSLQAVSHSNSEPNWIAYLGVQFLRGDDR
jgi:hypothetical protein